MVPKSVNMTISHYNFATLHEARQATLTVFPLVLISSLSYQYFFSNTSHSPWWSLEQPQLWNPDVSSAAALKASLRAVEMLVQWDCEDSTSSLVQVEQAKPDCSSIAKHLRLHRSEQENIIRHFKRLIIIMVMGKLKTKTKACKKKSYSNVRLEKDLWS